MGGVRSFPAPCGDPGDAVSLGQIVYPQPFLAANALRQSGRPTESVRSTCQFFAATPNSLPYVDWGQRCCSATCGRKPTRRKCGAGRTTAMSRCADLAPFSMNGLRAFDFFRRYARVAYLINAFPLARRRSCGERPESRRFGGSRATIACSCRSASVDKQSATAKVVRTAGKDHDPRI